MGQRIRRARLERGLSLAQVAGEDFSRAFLNQVEMGRSQPSTRVLRVIAARLGQPVDYLLGGADLERELAVERARLALIKGSPRRALELLAGTLEERSPLGSDARLCAAEALVRLGREAEAAQLVADEERLLRARGAADPPQSTPRRVRPARAPARRRRPRAAGGAGAARGPSRAGAGAPAGGPDPARGRAASWRR